MPQVKNQGEVGYVPPTFPVEPEPEIPVDQSAPAAETVFDMPEIVIVGTPVF